MAEQIDQDRIGMDGESLTRGMVDHLRFSRVKTLDYAHSIDIYHALSLAVRDR
ncbi:MAG: hypothetical protein ACI8S6_001818, partial [Myxococcota bacterium]